MRQLDLRQLGHGLKLAAVAVVAQAVLGMVRTLAPDARRAGIAVAALSVVTLAGSAYGQLLAIMLGVLGGLALCRAEPMAVAILPGFAVSRGAGFAAVAGFTALLIGGPLLAAATGSESLAVFDAFYRSGSLVFGGGHVVLPLLQARIVEPGWVSPDAFLSGYAVAQALPGPLFTFATYLGVLARPGPGGVAGGALATAGIFLPGLLLLVGALPFWQDLRERLAAQAALRGANAAVVGVLAAALYDPVWTGSIGNVRDFTVAAAAFGALIAWRAPPVAVVAACTVAGLALAKF